MVPSIAMPMAITATITVPAFSGMSGERHHDEHQRDRHDARHQRDEPALERGEHQRHHEEDRRQQDRQRLDLAPEQAIGRRVDHQVLAGHRAGHVGARDVAHHLAQFVDVAVQRGRVPDVVAHHDVGAAEIVADVGIEVAPLEEQQALRHQLARRRHAIGLGAAVVQLAVRERQLVRERQAAVEDALLGDEGLDVRELLQVRRVLERALVAGLRA